jgi:hypothetical protein
MKNMETEQIKSKILELCSESEYGSWEFWANGENKTETECMQIVQAIIDLVKEKKIYPVEYQTVADQTYQEVPLDVFRLENEVRRSMQPDNLDPHNFYWFLATEAG